MPVIKLENLLKSHKNKSLDKIIHRAQNMDALTSTLHAELSEDFAANLVAANIRDDGVLVLICRSPAWASRFRFEADRFLDIARRTGAEVHACHIKVGR